MHNFNRDACDIMPSISHRTCEQILTYWHAKSFTKSEPCIQPIDIVKSAEHDIYKVHT